MTLYNRGEVGDHDFVQLGGGGGVTMTLYNKGGGGVTMTLYNRDR